MLSPFFKTNAHSNDYDSKPAAGLCQAFYSIFGLEDVVCTIKLLVLLFKELHVEIFSSVNIFFGA